MPEPPDFKQIATQIASSIPVIATRAFITHDVAEQLRLIWNARGAADRAKLAAYLSRREEGTLLDEGIVSVEAFDRALRTLDR